MFTSVTVFVSGCGCDNCATVSLAWHRPSEQYVAVKRINLEQCEMGFHKIQVLFYIDIVYVDNYSSYICIELA